MNGEKFYSKIMIFSGDIPATRKALGLTFHSHFQSCSKCLFRENGAPRLRDGLEFIQVSDTK
jgi:hypothetical protein